MGMLFARRRTKKSGVTTSANLLKKEQSVQPKTVKSVPNEQKQLPNQPKFKI